jgi:tripartite-type tricarboxylate transporter receptor subunit TctC
MVLRNIIRLGLCAATVIGMLASAPAAADDWPSHPIRMLIPFPPGGVSDVMGRFWAQQLSDALKTPVIAENRPGAGTTLAAGFVAKAPADGYTLYFTDVTTHAINATLYRALPFKSDKDFTDIAMVAATPLALVVPATVPAQTLQEFIALAKSKPGQLNYASSGNGTILHLAGETLKRMAGIDMVHLPYKGSNDAIVATLSGQATATFSTLPPAIIQSRAGKLRVLGVTSKQANESLPEAPPIANTLPGFEMVIYSGIMGPAGMPRDIVDKINTAVATILQKPETRKFYDSIGADPVVMTPREFSDKMAQLIEQMGVALRESGAAIN